MIKPKVALQKRSLIAGPHQSVARDGEGHSVALTVLNVIQNKADGSETYLYGLDITQARVPQRRYAAELANVTVRDNELRFSFATRTVAEDGFESVLIIRLSPTAANTLVDSLKNMTSPSINEILTLINIKAEEGQPIDKSPENTGNVANLMANFIAIGVSGHETTLDFYHASAFAMRAMQETKSLDLDPKVRVDIRTGLFAGLVNKLPELLSQLSPVQTKGVK